MAAEVDAAAVAQVGMIAKLVVAHHRRDARHKIQAHRLLLILLAAVGGIPVVRLQPELWSTCAAAQLERSVSAGTSEANVSKFKRPSERGP